MKQGALLGHADLLFKNQQDLSVPALKQYARTLDLDGKQFAACDTPAILFAKWLAERTRMAPHERIPTEEGRICLQSIHAPLSVDAPSTLSMDAFYIVPKEGEAGETAYDIGSAISFRLIPLSPSRVEVRARGLQPAVAGTFVN